MSKFAITGGRRLKGELCPQGAKNEALQVICACLLTKEEVTLSNVPEILDVLKLIELLQGMGVQVGHPAHGEFVFKASDINFDYFETEDFYNKAVSLRGSIMILGPLLAVYGCGLIPKPGGDKIGRRRLDTHFLGFEKLGATFDYNSSEGCFRASAEKLRGCYMLLDEASVTGTANIIMAAVLAEGMTTIYNAACEPYIQQLCLMLNAMGARISGDCFESSDYRGSKGAERLSSSLSARYDRSGKLYRIGCDDPFGDYHPECEYTPIGNHSRFFPPSRYPDRGTRRRSVYSASGALYDRGFYRWLDSNGCGCALARFDTRLTECVPGGRYPG